MTKLTEDTLQTFRAISDPNNAHKFTAKAALEAFEMQKIETKFCKDCKHFSEGTYLEWCYHPALGINVVTSKLKTQYAAIMRLPNHLCGEDAKLFEEKSTTKSGYRTFIDKIKSHAIIAYMFNPKEQ